MCLMTLLYSRSQHLTCLSSPHEKRYGCLADTASPLTTDTWPVRDNFNFPLAKSQILMTLSAAPVANHSFPGSTVTHLTHPIWPDITLYSFQGACQLGFGMPDAFLIAIW